MNKKLQPKTTKSGFFISERKQDLFFILLLAAIVIAFLSPAIFGNGFNVSDNIASKSFETYLNDAKKDGNFPLWNPYLFSGMPSYASLQTTGDRWWDIAPQIVFGAAQLLGYLLSSDVARVAFYYILYGIGLYYLALHLTGSRLGSFVAGLAGVLSTGVIVWVMIGHNTKPVVFAFVPWVLFFLERLKIKFSLVYAALVMVSIHLMLEGGHVQMIFYAALVFGIYIAFELFSTFKNKLPFSKWLQNFAILAIAGGIAFAMSSDRYLSALEYKPHSVRGKGPIVQLNTTVQNEDGSNDYKYATMWSFSPEETIDFFVPNYHGFGKLPYKQEASSEATILPQLAQSYGGIVPSYWGQKPFEDVAPYMGLAVILLAFAGVWRFKNNMFVIFLVVLSLFALLLSFGYTFPILYDFFFYYVPNFSTFRAPSMVLVIVQFAIPLLAAFGIAAKSKQNDENTKPVWKELLMPLIFLAIGVVFVLGFNSTYIDSVLQSKMVSQFPEQYRAQLGQEIANFLWSATVTDWFTSGIVALLVFWLIYLYKVNKLGANVLYIGIIALIAFDLIRVSNRALNPSEGGNSDEVFANYDWINFIKEDKDLFRIAEFALPSPNMSAHYKLQNINGYHAAKLRVYQDLLDVAGGGSTSYLENPFLWNMMNVRYIVMPDGIKGGAFNSADGRTTVYANSEALPRAFFVDSVAVSDGLSILKILAKGRDNKDPFDPTKLAYLEKPLNEKISVATKKNVEIVSYKNEKIEMNVECDAPSLLFTSEVYYPGWKAYLDGKEIEVYKTNFAFRSVVVPAGKFKLEYKFDSSSFETGKNLSLASNILLVVLLALGIYFERKGAGKNRE